MNANVGLSWPQSVQIGICDEQRQDIGATYPSVAGLAGLAAIWLLAFFGAGGYVAFHEFVLEPWDPRLLKLSFP